MRHRRRLAAAVLAAALGVTATGCGFGDDSAREFVEGNYKRAAALDLDNSARAYTSPKSPDAVERAITKDWRPLDRFAHTSGVYLRYPDDVLAVQPNGSGTVVRVENFASGCARYRSTVGLTWACDRPAGDERDGGPGEGK